MKNRKLILAFVLLAAALIVAAVLHLSSRQVIGEGCIELIVGDSSQVVSLDDMSYEVVSGIRINGKGEEIPVEGMGFCLADWMNELAVTGHQKITVISDDSYSADIDAAESENAYFLREEQQLRLVVFGDKDSKRSVSNIKQIIVQ